MPREHSVVNFYLVVMQRAKKAEDGEILSEEGSESGDETRRRRRRLSQSDADSPAAAAGDRDKKRKKLRFITQCIKLSLYFGLGFLDGAAVWHRTRDRKFAGLTPGRGTIKSTFHPSGVGKSSTSLHGWD